MMETVVTLVIVVLAAFAVHVVVDFILDFFGGIRR